MKKLFTASKKSNTKRNKRSGSRGAVTVFLTLVLVPTIVFAAVFTDVSRVQYSKAMAESAADLALDSLISRYDEDLEQYYGFVASSQDIDEFYSKTTDYFAGMMRAEGISDANVAQFVDYMNSYFKSNDVSDFLKTEFDKAGINLDDMDSQLDGNAALIESEIVEFMKYRGPVEIGSKIIDRFLEDGNENAMGELKDASKNEPIVEAKQKYAEAEAEFLEKAYYTYLAIRVYEKAYDGLSGNESEEKIPSEKDYKTLEKETKNIWEDYSELTKLLTNYYICSDGVDDAYNLSHSFPDYEISDYEYDRTEIGTKVTVDGQDKYYLSVGTYNNIYTYSDYGSKVQSVTDAANSIRHAIEQVQTPANQSDIDEVVYLIKLKEALDGQSSNFDIIRNYGEELLTLYGEAAGALKCEEDPKAQEPLPGDWASNLRNEMDRIYACWEAFLSPLRGETQNDSGYKENIKSYIELAARVKDSIDNEKYTFTSSYLGRDNVSPSEFLREAGQDLGTLREILQKRHDELVNALGPGKVTVGGETKDVVPIMDLIALYNDYINKTDEWGAAAKKENTNYAQAEQARHDNVIHGLPEDGESSGLTDAGAAFRDNEGTMSSENLIKLRDRLTAIKDDIKKAIDAIDHFSYGNISISDITTMDTLISAASSVIPSNSDISISVNNGNAEKYFEQLISPQKDKIFTAPQITDANNPDLNVATPKIYTFLKSCFQKYEDEINQEISDNKKRTDEWKKQGDEAEKKAKEADMGDPTLKGHGEDTLDADGPHGGGSLSPVSALTSILTTIQDISNGGRQIRDKLYVIEYVMDMFSYSSFNTEGKRELAGENTTYKDFDSYNAKTEWEEKKELTFTPNKSLTNRMINSTNNQFNLAEVEYVIFGNTDMKKCLSQSYAGIYAIRASLNLVSGFANFYKSNDPDNLTALSITGIANAIAAASQGIIPAPVTKCVLITALSAIEAAKDLEVLKKGDSVPLYKVKYDQWYCAFNSEGKKDGSFGESSEVSREKTGLFYHDYMYLFLMMNTSHYENMLLRIGDLVEANMRQTKGNGEFDLGKSKCFFKLTAQAKVKPLMITLPIVQSYGTGDLLSNDTWCSYDIKVIRGY